MIRLRIEHSATPNAPQNAQAHAGIIELTREEMNCVAGGMRASQAELRGLKGK